MSCYINDFTTYSLVKNYMYVVTDSAFVPTLRFYCNLEFFFFFFFFMPTDPKPGKGTDDLKS